MTGETVLCQPGEGTSGPRTVLTLLNLAGSSASLYLRKQNYSAPECIIRVMQYKSSLGRIYSSRDINELNASFFERFALKRTRANMSLGDKKLPKQQTHRQAVNISDFPISRLVVSFNSNDQLVQVRGCQNCAAIWVTESSVRMASCEVGGGS